MLSTALLAHQGGWDEVLLVAAPMAVVAGLLVLAKRRVTRSTVESSPAEPAPDDHTIVS